MSEAMNEQNRDPKVILLTGPARSGKTFLGDMLETGYSNAGLECGRCVAGVPDFLSRVLQSPHETLSEFYKVDYLIVETNLDAPKVLCSLAWRHIHIEGNEKPAKELSISERQAPRETFTKLFRSFFDSEEDFEKARGLLGKGLL